MIQKLVVIMALIFLLIVAGVAAYAATPAAASAKNYSADRFDAQIAMQQGGSLLVTERVVFRFVGGPFTQVFRDLPTAYTDDITVLSAGMDGQPQGADNVSVDTTSSKDQVEVTWFLNAISDQVHTFDLRYRVQGVIQKTAGADALYWNALPTSYEYSIRSATITVSYPEKATLLDTPEVRRGSARVSTSPNQAVFSARNLNPDTPLEIGLSFRAGSVIARASLWQQVQQRTVALTFPSLVGGVLVFLLVSLGFFWYSRCPRRRTPVAENATSVLQEPPDGLPPAIASALVNPGVAPDWNGALGTLFDLAARGVLRISDEGSPGSSYPAADFIIRRQTLPQDLRPYERGLLQMLFPGQKATTIQVSQINPLYTRHAEWFTAPVKQEILDMGLLDPARQRIVGRLGRLTLLAFLIALLAGILILLFGASTGMWPLVLLSLGLLLSCIVALVLRSRYSPLSDQGAQAAINWRAFARYLGTPRRYAEARPDPALFDLYLPYAAALGLAIRWTGYFRTRGVAVPPWFQSLASAPAEDMHSFVRMVTATNVAGQPISESGSTSGHIGSSFSGGGSGGAAGGGGSGAH